MQDILKYIFVGFIKLFLGVSTFNRLQINIFLGLRTRKKGVSSSSNNKIFSHTSTFHKNLKEN